MKKMGKSLLAILLSVLMVVYLLPLGVFAEQKEHDTTKENNRLKNSVPLDDPGTIADAAMEETEMRTANTKYIRLADGSHYVAQYENDVHYIGEDGLWQEFDNTLFSSAAKSAEDISGYETSNSIRSIKFANNSNSSKLLAMKEDDYKISFGVVGANKSKAATVTNPDDNDNFSTNLEKLTVVKKNVSSVTYAGIWNDVDLQYIVIGNDVKENIIVHKAKDSYTYEFDLKLNKLYAEMQNDGTIGLFDGKTDELQYILPLPFMYDAEGKYSTAVEFSLQQTKNKEYRLTVTADAAWINDSARAFPVTIDPIINKNTSSSITDTMINETFSTSNYIENTNLMVGYTGDPLGGRIISLIKVNSLPDIPDDSIITKASFSLKCSYAMNTASIRVGAYKINNAWDEVSTWSTFYEDGAISDELLDYNNVEHGGQYEWNITRLVREWYQNPSSNKGIAFDSVAHDFYSGSAAITVIMDSSDNSAGTVPVFTLVYRDAKGIEDYYTYQNYSAGRAGTAYLSDYTSEMTLLKSDVSYSNASLGFDVFHVYNTAYSGRYFTYDSSKGVNAIKTANYNGMIFGDGWKLNIQESVRMIGIEGESYIVYNDTDGTEHYFSYTSPGVYHDEDGLGLTCEARYYGDIGAMAYIIHDDENNSKEFINGMLTCITDSNGNTVRIYYKTYTSSTATIYPSGNGNDIFSHITVKNAGNTTEETIFSFVFNSSTKLLTSMTNVVENTTTTFSYTYNSTTGTYLLTGITNTDNTTVSYSYADGKMTCAFDNYNIYGYDFAYLPETSKIGFITETTGGNGLVTGKEYKVENDFGFRTVYTYGGKDGSVSAHGDGTTILDNIITEYVFDYSGRTVNSSSRTYYDMVLLSSTYVQYLEPGEDLSKSNNQVGLSASSSQKASNYLLNSSFETQNTDWESLTQEISKSHSGIYSAKLTGQGSGEAYLRQLIPITLFQYTEGQESHYTYSAYINTSEVTSFANNGGVYIKLVDTNGNTVAQSDKIRVKTSEDAAGGWMQISVSFSSDTSCQCYAYLCASGVSGSVYFDDVQITYSENTGAYSYVQNGGMELPNTSWNYTTDGSMTMQYIHSADSEKVLQGYKSIKVSGNPLYTSTVSQNVTLHETKYSTYALSGWARATSVFGADSMFALKAVVHYSDNFTEEFIFEFNPEVTGWQYVEGVIQPFETIENEVIKGFYLEDLANGYIAIISVDVSFVFDHNNGDAYIDEINLVKNSTTSYVYDEDGELVQTSSTDPTSTQVTTLTYDKNSNNYTVQEGDADAVQVTRDANYNITGISQSGIDLTMTGSNGLINTTKVKGENDPQFLFSHSTYSADGKYLTADEDSNGITTNYTYYANGKLQSVTRGNTRHDYDYMTDSDKLSVEYIAGLVSLTYSYSKDAISQIARGGFAPFSSVKETMNYNFTYTPFGRLETISIENSTPLITYIFKPVDATAYKGNTNPAEIEFANGNTIEYSYDMLDRVSKIGYYNNSNIGVTKATLRYDGFGNICRVEDAENGKVYLYDYGTDGVLHYAVVIHSDGTQQIMYAAQDDSGNTTKTFTGIGAGQSVTSSYTYSQGDNQLTSGSVTYKNGSLSSTNNFSYGYDSLQRMNQKSYTALVGSGTRTMTQTYAYRTISSGVDGIRTSNQISSLTWKYTGVSDLAFAYTYDAMGNISTVKRNGVLIASYEYDEQGQLIQETLPQEGYEYNYIYDSVGNLTIVEKVNTNTFEIEEVLYSYDGTWKDQLTSFNGNTITYDASGNPLIYNNGASYAFTWNSARNLTSVVKGGVTTTYQYNLDGLRTKKQYGSTTYQYYYDGDKLLRQTWGSNYMDFLYDESGEIYSLIYNGTQYYYVRNLQGDVVQIRSIYGTAVVEYTYDAWGNVLSITGQYANSLGQNNPIRYRGYFYDFETGFYYLQSRYYDPAIRRFISADDPEMLGANGTFIGYNLYAYCDNNPVNYSDPSGHFVLSFKLKLALTAGFIWGLYDSTTECYGLSLNSWSAWIQLGLTFAKGFIRGFFTVYSMMSLKTGRMLQIIKGVIWGVIYVVVGLVSNQIHTVKDAFKTFAEGYGDTFVPTALPERFAKFRDIFNLLRGAFELSVS